MLTGITRPVPAVGAIILRDNEILLIQRGANPGKGQWSVPGGSVELGETLKEGVARETLEETGLVVEVGDLSGVFDVIVRDGNTITFHYVLVDYFATVVSGVPSAATDAVDCKWVRLEDIGSYDITQTLLDCLRANGLIE